MDQIVVVTEGGAHIWAIVNALADRFGPVTVILESPEPKAEILRRRARKMGWVSASGQLGTMVLTRLGKRLFAGRAARIVSENGLLVEPRAEQKVLRVSSADSVELVSTVGKLEPQVILLAGCRLLSPKTLAALPCPVLNYHAGIAPKYRGMNGGYFALATGDAENFGATVHLVDAGVDTGAVLYQVKGKPGAGDNIMLYALRLAALSRDIVIRAVKDALEGRLALQEPAPGTPSRQWYHPTVWSYLWTGATKGVW